MFVALFFISVGMLIDINFVREHILAIVLLVLAAFIVNNLINTLIMRAFRMSWKDSIYGGALLSQIGEFSFVLGNLAHLNNIISDYAYQMTVAVISLTLLLSPMWINVSRMLTAKN